MHQVRILVLLFFITSSFSQQYLAPGIKKSFGNNGQTNRDVAYFSDLDHDGNVIITGTTEHDSTFTDLITTKLDADLHVLWQKQYSFQKNRGNEPFHVSYDTPKSTCIDQDNNIYVSGNCRNWYPDPINAFYIVKYSASGEELWHIDFPFGPSGTNPGYVYAESFFENNQLHVVYGLVNEDNTAVFFTFYTINADGQIIDSYEKYALEDAFGDNFTGISYKFYYRNNHFYMVYRRHNLTTQTSFYEHFIRKINAGLVTTYALNPIIDIASTENFASGNLLIDQNDAVYLGYNSNNLLKYRIIKYDASGNLVYNINPPVGTTKSIAKSFLNASDNLCILNSSSMAGNPSFNLTEFDAAGTILSDIATQDISIQKAKIGPDYSIMVYNGISLRLFDASLNLQNTYTLNAAEVNDFCKVDNNTIISASTTSAQMYPNSDSFTEKNIVVEKRNPVSVEQAYTFSGEGTSMSYGARITIDHDDNILIANYEKYGEAPLTSNGTQPPTKSRIIKYDSNLSMLWQVEIPTVIFSSSLINNFFVDNDNNFYTIGMTSGPTYKLIKISPSGQLLYSVPCSNTLNTYIDENGNINFATTVDNPVTPDDTKIETISALDGSMINTQIFSGQLFFKEFKIAGHSRLYLYQPATQSSAPLKIFAYDNMNFAFSTNLNATGTYMGAGGATYDNLGNLFFLTSNISSYDTKLNKITPSGVYTYNAISLGLTKFTTTYNNKLFALNTDGKIRIYDNDLNLLTLSTENYSYDYNALMRMGNHMLLNTFSSNTVQVIDENAQTIMSFKIPSTLATYYGVKDSTEKLFVTGSNSGQITSQLAWSRGFVHKYDIPNMLGTTDFLPENHDAAATFYPNPTDSFVTVKKAGTIIKTEVYDMTGRFIKASSNPRIDISDCLPAVYLLKAYSVDGTVTSSKILKK